MPTDDQPAVYVLTNQTCLNCKGKGGNDAGFTCSDCDGRGVFEAHLPLAQALREDPGTRAALREWLAEVAGELRDAGQGYEFEYQ